MTREKNKYSIFDPDNDKYREELKERLDRAVTDEYLLIKDVLVVYYWSVFDKIRYMAFILKLMDDRKAFMAFHYAKKKNKKDIKTYLQMKATSFVYFNRLMLTMN